ncbi:MAG TPA: inorganic phosphate transporter [Candidatus Paceibacterota bacterium]|nr:inorganic phosphate transporter [Verrucomicrobiota bacterium]HRY46470.1 inorganic phosphate transporter [Candidatus Paceibacterota bacterium]HSA03555.1 inorganic phosphate transporter [Candidatus Paceibacterota bacterium]
MSLVIGVIVVALIFEYINGFHDTANSIATVVSTKVLSPRQAVMLAALFNLLGALWGTAVATTIGKGLVDTQFVTLPAILCALLAAIIWGLITWWLGLPSSSSHALIGGLCGATLASAASDWSVIKWSVINPATHKLEGIWPKVVIPMVTSPVFGVLIGFLFMALLLVLLRHWTPHWVNATFGKLQLVSASLMGFSHGTNDAQKTMGIIALTTFTATQSGLFQELPAWLSFLDTPKFEVHTWVKITCALTMAAGTAAGGWRIINTLGHKMVKLQPIHGFAAETTAATVIQVASHWGIPLSTTHVISTSIMGVGATKRLSAVKWGVVERMLWAWIFTLPVTGLLGYFGLILVQVCF